MEVVNTFLCSTSRSKALHDFRADLPLSELPYFRPTMLVA